MRPRECAAWQGFGDGDAAPPEAGEGRGCLSFWPNPGTRELGLVSSSEGAGNLRQDQPVELPATRVEGPGTELGSFSSRSQVRGIQESDSELETGCFQAP